MQETAVAQVLVRKTSRRFFRRGKEQRRVLSGCQASAILEALAKMTDGERLMMAILSLKTDETKCRHLVINVSLNSYLMLPARSGEQYPFVLSLFGKHSTYRLNFYHC